MNKLEQKSGVIDLNHKLLYSDDSNKGVIYEYRQNCFFSTHGISAVASISQMRKTIQGRLQSSKVFMNGSIPVHGLCPTDLSRKSPRYRSLFAIHARQTLSHGHPQIRVAQAKCLGKCTKGAHIMVYPDNVWHSEVTLDHIDALAAKYLPKS